MARQSNTPSRLFVQFTVLLLAYAVMPDGPFWQRTLSGCLFLLAGRVRLR